MYKAANKRKKKASGPSALTETTRKGKTLFNKSCYNFHVQKGVGGIMTSNDVH